jgi:methylthioribose-1-phosphate isomerase
MEMSDVGEDTMKVMGHDTRSIWVDDDGFGVRVIDQTLLPHAFETRRLAALADAVTAIRDMWVRGAPLIGAAAAYGVALAMNEDDSDHGLHDACAKLIAARPTAVNLAWAVEEMHRLLSPLIPSERLHAAYAAAAAIADEDVAINSAIGDHGLRLIRRLAEAKEGKPLNIMTHCNAGWLATVDWGTATAPIYKAHEAGVPMHVYVSETRPRNQGAFLTAWELANHGVPHTVVVDNAAGHLMQHGDVDLVIVGTDRTTARGDVCNKIGTYLKALAAKDNGIPFYVAAPSPSIDFTMRDGLREIPIETRSSEEVTHIAGLAEDGSRARVRLTPAESPAINHGFDVTPARLVTGLITERGIVDANERALAEAFPDRLSR